jgi:large subunit ribosomal protein L5
MSNLKKKYLSEIVPSLKSKHQNKNPMEIPKLTKIVVSMGIAEALKDKNVIQDHAAELALLTGQKPAETKARKAISNFKLREDQTIGLKVTLRGKRMYDFMERFCHIVAPRIRDFRGFERKADGRGNYHVGLQDQQVFPEIDLDKVKRAQGMNIAFVTTANSDGEAVELLEMMGFPFK